MTAKKSLLDPIANILKVQLFSTPSYKQEAILNDIIKSLIILKACNNGIFKMKELRYVAVID
jgi:hypothetical protein